MGGVLNKSQEEISESLREEYQMEVQPCLLHKRTQQLCTLHKITTNSAAEAKVIRQIIDQYATTRCLSISKLRTHYHLDNTGYCSDQQNFYLVFDGQNNYTLREEYVKRRLYRTHFQEQEIEQIIETYLCGLREYDHRFQRDYSNLSLDSVVIDQKSKRIWLKDPWLATTQAGDHADSVTALLLQYPSPEKLRTALSNKMEDYKEFLSNLFSVAVIALELTRLQFADSIYTRKKEVNYEEIKARLGEIKSERLRKGMECLLDPNPTERKRIYQMWGIENKQEHFLEPIQPQKLQQQQSSPNLAISTNKQQAPVQSSKFRFPSIPLQELPTRPKLNFAPSQAVFSIPPLNIPNNFHAPSPLSTRSNNQRPNSQPRSPLINQSNFTPLYQNTVPYTTARPASQNHSSNPTQPSISFQIDPTRSVPTNQFQGMPQFNAPKLAFNDYLHKEQKKVQRSNNVVPIFSQPRFEPANYIIPKKLVQVAENTIPFRPQEDVNSLPKSNLGKEQIQGLRSQSLQTHESPSKDREVKSIIFQSQEIPAREKSSSIIQSLIEENHINEAPKISKQEITANQLLKAVRQESNHPFIMRDNSESEELPPIQTRATNTPERQPPKNKYNSVIVEVRDEDTPNHSQNSQSVHELEEEYVVEEYETGSRYEGFKSNGMRNGKGKFFYQDGGYYEGQWKNNKMDGYGKLYYEGGKLAYEGHWEQDEFNGQGKVYNDNPVKLETPYDYTDFYLLEDYWEYYEGMLVHDTKEGRGKIKLSNGQMFQGDFHNDLIQGFGKFHTMQGKTIEGIWRGSKLIKVITND